MIRSPSRTSTTVHLLLLFALCFSAPLAQSAPATNSTSDAKVETATAPNPGPASAADQNSDSPNREPQQDEPVVRLKRRKNKKKKVVVEATPTPAPSATPAQEIKIGKIVVRGNKKIETDAVVSRLVSKPGDIYTIEKVHADVEALFKAGYFYDVRVDRGEVHDGVADLTYTVVEKPSVVEISYSGNSEVETDDLKEATALKAFEILNMSKIREATEKLQKLYEDKGYFLARVTPKIETVTEGESVKLTFEIQENDKVKVKRITFLGNKNISDTKIKDAMQTKEGGFFSFISGSGAYKQDSFDRDIQLVGYLYFNEGYVQAKVDRPQVYVTPDKKGIYITFRVEEGERFHVGTVDFSGDLLFDRDDLFKSIGIDKAGWYSHETLLKDIRTLTAKYGDLGYAYTNVIPRTRIRDKDREVDITFEIDKGNKVYFGKITVVGNSKTRDKVVRRELTIREGELYNETRKRESFDNVKRLGYFDDVQFNSSTPPDNSDLMNLDIVVKERNTGQIQVGAGYSTYSGVIFNGRVEQQNLFGRGQRLGVSVDLSNISALYSLNFTEPYFMDTLWSTGFDLYQSRVIKLEYADTRKGGAIRIGHPLAPYLHGYVRYKLEETEVDPIAPYGDPNIFPVPIPGNPNPPGNPDGWTSSATWTLEYDKRNDRLAPTEGYYGSGSIEYAGLGGDQFYTKGVFTARFYEKIFWNLVFRNNLTYGFIHANIADTVPPFNELFLLGGATTLRGFDWYTIGRKRISSRLMQCYTAAVQDPTLLCPPRPGQLDPYTAASSYARVPYGGTQEFYYNAELEFPLISEAQIKGVVFFDAGVADDEYSIEEFREDVGFGFRWFSPIGPLRFEWGFPIARQDSESAVNFQFAIGSPF